MKQQDKKISFSDFSGGLNEVDNSALIKDNQFALGSFNLTPTRQGLKRRRAFIKDTALTSIGIVNSIFSLPNEQAYIFNANGLFDFYGNTSRTNSTDITTLYNGLGPSDYSEGLVFYAGKRNVLYCDIGTSGAKVYPIGLQIVSLAVADYASGGSLVAGTYSVLVTLSKKSSSFGQFWGRCDGAASVTLGSSNLKISVTPPTSFEQATHWTIWIKAPGESVHYSYGDYTDFISNVVLSDTSLKNQSLIYETEVVNNISPEYDYGGVTSQNYFGLCIHNKALYIAAGENVNDNKTVIYSRRATSQADYFKFDDDAFIVYPFKIFNLFSLGTHLYISTEGGLIRQPYGDPSNEFEFVDRNIFFLHGTSLQKYKGRIIGLTNAGLRVFDGMTFSSSLSDSINFDYVYSTSLTNQIGSFLAYSWFNVNEVSYHWCSWESGVHNNHYAISIDQVLNVGYAPIVKYDITALTGFYASSKTYLIQSNETSPCIALDRGETGTGTAKDSNIIKSTTTTKVSTYVDFALYTKRKYISTESTMRAREMRIIANKLTDNESSSGIVARVKAYSL